MSEEKRNHLSNHRTTHPAIITIFAVIIVLLLGVNNPSLAQDGGAEVTVEPVSTDTPTETAPTEAETTAPTEEPTSIPESVTPEMTETAAPETTESVTEQPTVEATLTPTVESVPPVFNFTSGTTFEAQSGVLLTFQLSVSDEERIVRVTADTTTTLGTVSLTSEAPLETAAPFNTLVTVSYTSAAGFSGLDTFTLLAIDASGATSMAQVTVNVLPEAAPVTLTPTSLPYSTKELLINYNPAATEDAIQAMLLSLNAVELSRIPQIGAMRVMVPETIAVPAVAMTTLQSSGTAYLAGVSSMEDNGYYYLSTHGTSFPNDDNLGLQWGFGESTAGTFIERAWDASTTRGYGITVAVLDSGLDTTHPEFLYQTVAGWDFVNDDNNPADDSANGHGTHIAGIIAAKTNNGVGIAGVAYSAKIMPIKVCDAANACSFFHVAGGIVHAVDKGAKVINLSLAGVTQSSTVEAAINYAVSRGVVVVAAAGNIGGGIVDGDLVYPASYPGVISVAAHDNAGNRATYSNSNNMVDISAPGGEVGTGIFSTLPGNTYGELNGTSQATAYVSGVAALILSAKVATTPATVLDALVCGAEGDLDPNPANNYGRLKADFSMNWHENSSSCEVTQPNDNFEAAKVITPMPFTFTQPVHSRSVTVQATDPNTICGVPKLQTLWFSFKPTVTGYYQISTLGSSYDNVFGVYQGTAGALSEVGCSLDSQKPISMQAYQPYYIVVGTDNGGVAVDDQILQLRVNAALPANKVDYQENAVYFAYSGSWVRGAVTGSSGGYTQQTFDVNGAAAFSFRGIEFDYVRTVGPDRGQVLIYINNNAPITVDNRGAIVKANQVYNIEIAGATAGQWNTVRIMRDGTVPGVIDLDRIKTYDFDEAVTATAFAGKVDDRSTYLKYAGGTDWTNVTVATSVAYLGTLKQTDDTLDAELKPVRVQARVTGNAITVFRMTGTTPVVMADMEVVIDGIVYSIPNPSGANVVRPYTIDGLVAMQHVVEIRKVGTDGDGINIQLDAVQGATLATLGPAISVDERSTNLAYRGTWTDNAGVGGAMSLTTRTLTTNTEVSFKFTGNDLCVGYKQVAGTLQMYIDGTLMDTITAVDGVGFLKWCLDANGNKLVADGTHYARLVVTSATFTLDYVRPQRYTTLTPARGIVQETDVAFRYKQIANWIRPATKSVGGYAPQGGYYRETATDGETVTFYINGTGFILYTFMGPSRGCLSITVDGGLYDFDPGAGVDTVLDLNGDGSEFVRDQPLGFGVVGLNPGIHHIVLEVANSDCGITTSNFFFDLDAVRVFP
jgi:thermitase